MNLLELRTAIDTMLKAEPSTGSAVVTVVAGGYTIEVDGVSIVDDESSRVINVDYVPVV